MDTTNPLEMPDEDFQKTSGRPPETETLVPPVQVIETTAVVEEPVVETVDPETPQVEETAVETKPEDVDPLSAEDGAAPAAPAKTEDKPAEKPAGETGKDEAAVPGSDEAKPEPEQKPIDYEKAYTAALAPIRANGKDFVPKDMDELRRLAQMGAGYGKKIQDLQPALKTISMLEKEKVTTEELSQLLDIRRGVPGAMEKFLKDREKDPLDINVEDAASYRPVDRSVSDAEIAFNDALEELESSDGGSETLKVINRDWDDESIRFLGKHPQVMASIHAQRQTKVYDAICEEIDRQKTLGNIKPGTPFLGAYEVVGKALKESGALEHLLPTEEPAQDPAGSPPTPATPAAPQPRVVETRVEAPKPAVKPDARAKAAGTTSTKPAPAKVVTNPLEMADEDFSRQFAGRL